jgi:hypothetical protein
VNRSRRNGDRRRPVGRRARRALTERSDEQLVELVLDGHDGAFEVLFERHVADALWRAREALGSWGDAEDAVRHSFAAAHAYLETRGRGTEFAPWLNTILGNYCLSILQARKPNPARPADGSVVDLGEWRLRRKLLGITLPIPAGLRESVMAACGIGGGAAATAGAPLLGGTLAKLAVVAVLAGGVGAAGDASSSDRAASAAAPRAPVERVVDEAGGSRASVRDLVGRMPRPVDTTARKPARPPRTIRDERAPRDDVTEGPSPVGSAPATGGSLAAPAASVPDSATVEVSASVPPPVESTLRQAIDLVESQLPGAGSVSQERLPGAAGLAKIGDDLGVTSVESPIDVRALLAQGTDAKPE